MKFNNGGRDGNAAGASTIGAQFNDQFWSKVSIKEGRKQIIFSQIGDKLTQPKNYGDKIVKYHEIPIIDERNVSDQGIDANGAILTEDKWYSYDVDGNMLAPTAGSDTKADAKAVVGTVSILSGNGNMYGGDTDFAVVKGSFPALREEGGLVNRMGMTRLTLEAQVKEFGFYIPFTKEALDMDTEPQLLARISREIGTAQAEIREAQIQSDLLTASENNRTYAGSATSLATCDDTSILTFATIRATEQSLKYARSPKQTKLIDGSTNVDTQVIGAGYIAYVPQEAYPTLEDMTNGSVPVWKPIESYAAAGSTTKDEIGKVSATRFIEVEEMQNYEGTGAATPDANFHSDGTNYTVFPILYVGTDSFATVGFSGDVARVTTAMPRAIPGLDPYGKNGSVSISWYYGTMIYRNERIRQIACTLKIS